MRLDGAAVMSYSILPAKRLSVIGDFVRNKEMAAFSPRWDHLSMAMLLDGDVDRLRYRQHCRRVAAIWAVLGRMPQDSLKRFAEINAKRALYWFIPCGQLYGLVQRLPEGDMIFLAETLELMSDAAIMGAVAHELAHLVREHLEVPLEDRGDNTTEHDADSTAKAWGFEKELAAYQSEAAVHGRELWGKLAQRLLQQTGSAPN